MTDQKRPIDWAEIRRDYETSPMSVRELGRWYKVSDTAIRKRATAEGWKRPEGAGGSQREPANPTPPIVYVGTVLTPENVSPEAIVGRGRNLVLRMLDELEATTNRLGELEAIIETATDTGHQGKAREALMQAVSLKQRSEVLKSLVMAAKGLAETSTVAPAGGKKAERQAAAEKVGGMYAPPAAPKLAVDNTR